MPIKIGLCNKIRHKDGNSSDSNLHVTREKKILSLILQKFVQILKFYKIFYKILATQNQSSDQEQQLYKFTEFKKK